MIDRLPPEIVIETINEVDVTSLLACRLICRRIHSIVTENAFSLYLAKLTHYGYRDVPTIVPISSWTRLHLFVRHILKWQDPNWERMSLMRIPHNGSTYELQGGTFFGGTASTRGLTFTELPWRSSWMPDTPLASAQTIPTSKSTADFHAWANDDVGIDVHDFQADPAQDLMILVERMVSGAHNTIAVHARSISHNAPHPESTHPRQTVSLPANILSASINVNGFIIQIMDDIVGILVSYRVFHAKLYQVPLEVDPSSSRLEIYNWKTGQHYGAITQFGIDSIVFLDASTIAVIRRVVEGQSSHPRSINVDIYTFRSHENHGLEQQIPGLHLKSRLGFPIMPDEPAVVCRIVARCEPGLSFSTVPVALPTQMMQPPKPFRPHSSARIIILSFSTLQTQSIPHDWQFAVVMRGDDLLQLSKDASGFVPWAKWGPPRTRWFNTRMPSQWICYSNSGRMVELWRNPGGDPDERNIKIRDFHPSAVNFWIDATRGEYPVVWARGNRIEVVTDTSVFNDPNIWTEPVESSLPYVEMLSHRKWKDAASSAAMLDEDRVIVTPSSEESTFEIYSV